MMSNEGFDQSDWETAKDTAKAFAGLLADEPKLKVLDAIEGAELKSLNSLWKENLQYPRAEYVGVYFIFSEKGKLLYVGKASNSSSIGIRLSSYFKTDPHNKTKYSCTGQWKTKPAWVGALGIQSIKERRIASDGRTRLPEYSWVAAGIEEFLIDQLDEKIGLSENTIGK